MFCRLIETRLLTCRRVLQGDWKSNCCRGKIKDRAKEAPENILSALEKKLYSFSQSEWEKENGRQKPQPPGSKHYSGFFVRLVFVPRYLFPLNHPVGFLLLCPTSSLLLSSSGTQTHAHSKQVWRLCKQLIPGADRMPWQTLHFHIPGH